MLFVRFYIKFKGFKANVTAFFVTQPVFGAFANLSLVLIFLAIGSLQTTAADPLQDRPVLVA